MLGRTATGNNLIFNNILASLIFYMWVKSCSCVWI